MLLREFFRYTNPDEDILLIANELDDSYTIVEKNVGICRRRDLPNKYLNYILMHVTTTIENHKSVLKVYVVNNWDMENEDDEI